MNPIIIIPARMSASRLPGKPLAMIAGVPMIVQVWRRAREADLGPVAVACGEIEIADAVRDYGGMAVLTDPHLASGSDRVFHALRALDPLGHHDVVVNLQGDLPSLPPSYIGKVLEPLARGSVDIATLVAPITGEEEARAESVVKAACSFAPGTDIAPVLYFSRLAVPWGDGALWHHIGIYGWRREALQRFVELPPSGLEVSERLEQLRALEAGMRMAAARVERAPFGVDTPADLEKIRKDMES